MSSSITVVAQGHPVNYWFLGLFAYPVVSVGGGSPVRLPWGGAGRRLPAEPGTNAIGFRLYYRGIPKPVSSSDSTVEVGADEEVRVVVRNGWSNQHPFIFERVGTPSMG
jgi:hypothetical protein